MPKSKSTAHQVMRQVANNNRLPKNKLFVRMFFIGLIVAPIVAWLLWLN